MSAIWFHVVTNTNIGIWIRTVSRIGLDFQIEFSLHRCLYGICLSGIRSQIKLTSACKWWEYRQVQHEVSWIEGSYKTRYLTRIVPKGHPLTYTSQRSVNLCGLWGYWNRAAKDLLLLWCDTWPLRKVSSDISNYRSVFIFNDQTIQYDTRFGTFMLVTTLKDSKTSKHVSILYQL